MLAAAERRAPLPPWRVVAGGAERQYSVANGLAACSKAAEVVLVHDAARPLIRPAVIEAVIEAARAHGGAIAAVPEKNTVKVVDAAGVVVSTPARSTLWAVQTPQGFRRELLERAHAHGADRAGDEARAASDDAGLVEALGETVWIVPGDELAAKITTARDLALARLLKEAP